MADVFISYAKTDRALAQRAADFVGRAGYSVWWDDHLSHEDFRDRIEAELAVAKAVIVLWTPRSIERRFVRDEADAALQAGKLVQVLGEDLNATELPLGFRSMNAIAWEDWPKALRAVEVLAGSPARPDVASLVATPADADQQPPAKGHLWEMFLIDLSAIGVAALLLFGLVSHRAFRSSDYLRESMDIEKLPPEHNSPLLSENTLIIAGGVVLCVFILWRVFMLVRRMRA